MRRVRPLFASLAVVAVVAAGCTDTAKPIEPTDGPPSSTQPAAEPPELPDLAKQESAEGASTFVDYYLEVINFAAQTGDTEPLQAFSDAGCTACSKFIATVTDTYNAGGNFTGGEWSIGDVTVQELQTVWSVRGVVATTPGTQIPEAGGEPRQSDETQTAIEFQIQFNGTSWTTMSFSGAR